MALHTLSPAMTIQEVLDGIALAQAKDVEINRRLEQLLINRAQIENMIQADLPEPLSDIKLADREATLMTDKIAQTCISALELSSKVRALDLTQSHLQQAVDRVENVLDLKMTAETVEKAISDQDYEAACQNTYRVLREGVPVQNDPSYLTVVGLEHQLRNLVVKEVEKVLPRVAERSGDRERDTVYRYARLFGMVGLAFRGLCYYAQVTRSVLKLELDDEGASLAAQPSGAVIAHLDLLVKVLDKVASALRQHVPVVQQNFGPGAHLRLIQELQRETDEQAAPLVRQFIEARSLASWVRQIRASLKKLSAAPLPGEGDDPASDDDGIDPRKVDTLLEEMSYLARECEVFDVNLRELGNEAHDVLAEASKLNAVDASASVSAGSSPGDGPSLSHAVLALQHDVWNGMSDDALGPALVRSSKLNEYTQEIIGYYVATEEYYMICNMRKAMAMDETTDGESLTSTVVDDVFYILKKCVERALFTCNASSVCALLNHVNALLSSPYKGFFARQLRVYATRLGKADHFKKLTQTLSQVSSDLGAGNFDGTASRMASMLLTDDAELRPFFVLLNNICTSAEHIVTLRRHVEQEYSAVFADRDDALALIGHCLGELSHTSDALKAMVNEGLLLVVAELKTRLGPLLNLNNVSYDFSEADYNDRQVDDMRIEKLLAAIDAHSRTLKQAMTEANHVRLLSLLVDWVSRSYEEQLLKKKGKISFWGGLQVDKDVRCLSTGLVGHRDKFARLAQISSLLQVVKVTEVLDFFAGGTSVDVWDLDTDFMRHVLSLRSDFTQKSIDQLKF